VRNLFLISALLLAVFAVGCKKTDVVGGRTPVSNSMADMQGTLDALAKLPAAQRAAYMQQHHPDLAQRVVYFLRQRGKIQSGAEVQGVDFFFGSLSKVKAEDGTGQIVQGYFKDQLVARVRVAGLKDPIAVIVRCLNGTFELPEDLARAGMAPMGTQRLNERFTIGKGDNLVSHVGYRTAIDLAEKHNLQLVRGKGAQRQKIGPAEARRLESETDRIQVSATVFEGDQFDLVAGTYTPAPKKQAPPARRRSMRRR